VSVILAPSRPYLKAIYNHCKGGKFHMIELMLIPLLVALGLAALAGALASAAVKLTARSFWKASFDFSGKSLVLSTLMEIFIMACAGVMAFIGLERFSGDAFGHPWRLIFAFAMLSTCLHVPFAIFANMPLFVAPATDIRANPADQKAILRAALLGLPTPIVANLIGILLYLQIR
jgi:hypothetical protein